MTKYLILFIFLINSYLLFDTTIIYAKQSAEYHADDCCLLNSTEIQNSDIIYSQECQDIGNYYGCGMSRIVPLLNAVNRNVYIIIV